MSQSFKQYLIEGGPSKQRVKLRTGFDFTGNKVIKVSIPGEGTFSIQTNGNLPQTHSMDARSLDYTIALDEIQDFVGQYGTKRQQKIMNKFSGHEEEMEAKQPNEIDLLRADGRGYDKHKHIISKTRRKQHIDRHSRRTRGSNHEEEMEANMPAVRDRVKKIEGMNRHDDVSLNRAGQRARRNLRGQYGYQGTRNNAADVNEPEEEMESRVPANRDRMVRIRKDIAAPGYSCSDPAYPSDKRAGQSAGRSLRGTYGKEPGRGGDYSREEEMEANVPARRDRDMEFQGNMDRLNKPTANDDRQSTPRNKRLKQRFKRYNKKTWGEQEEEFGDPEGMATGGGIGITGG